MIAMKKIISRIKYWLSKSYLEKHIKILQIQRVFVPLDGKISEEIRREYELRTMAIDLADELIRSKAIIVEEEDEFSTQNKIVRIKLRYWL